MTPSERRWKWVRRDCLPEEMIKILSGPSKVKKPEDGTPDPNAPVTGKVDAGLTEDFITQLNVKNWLELEYTSTI